MLSVQNHSHALLIKLIVWILSSAVYQKDSNCGFPPSIIKKLQGLEISSKNIQKQATSLKKIKAALVRFTQQYQEFKYKITSV